MKNIIKVVALFLSVCVLMTSCITTYHLKIISTEDEARARWKGATKQEIIQNFGPPNSERSDGGDGTLLVYNMNRSDGETINRSHYIWFYLNSNNVCTNLKSDYFYKTERIPVRKLSGAGIAIIVLLSGVGLAALCGLIASGL